MLKDTDPSLTARLDRIKQLSDDLASVSARSPETMIEFQSTTVRIAARHLENRGGVILGDVGLDPT